MASLLRMLEADVGLLVSQFLPRNEQQPLMMLSSSEALNMLNWVRELKADIARVRSCTHVLQTLPLKFPGFCSPARIRCLSRSLETYFARGLGTEPHLLDWMEAAGLQNFSPCEAILIMNAWPAATRDAGAALSDFLAEADPQFFYRTSNIEHAGLQDACIQAQALVYFTYRGLNGVLKIEEYRHYL